MPRARPRHHRERSASWHRRAARHIEPPNHPEARLTEPCRLRGGTHDRPSPPRRRDPSDAMRRRRRRRRRRGALASRRRASLHRVASHPGNVCVFRLFFTYALPFLLFFICNLSAAAKVRATGRSAASIYYFKFII